MICTQKQDSNNKNKGVHVFLATRLSISPRSATHETLRHGQISREECIVVSGHVDLDLGNEIFRKLARHPTSWLMNYLVPQRTKAEWGWRESRKGKARVQQDLSIYKALYLYASLSLRLSISKLLPKTYRQKPIVKNLSFFQQCSFLPVLVRMLWWLGGFGGLLIILATHQHYSSDVLVAVYLSTALYL